jgi:hypothetical protein
MERMTPEAGHGPRMASGIHTSLNALLTLSLSNRKAELLIRGSICLLLFIFRVLYFAVSTTPHKAKWHSIQ